MLTQQYLCSRLITTKITINFNKSQKYLQQKKLVFVAMQILLSNNKFATYLVTKKITNYFNRIRNQLQKKNICKQRKAVKQQLICYGFSS
jgi:hypothetical protein